jgi:hypothetical protein
MEIIEKPGQLNGGQDCKRIIKARNKYCKCEWISDWRAVIFVATSEPSLNKFVVISLMLDLFFNVMDTTICWIAFVCVCARARVCVCAGVCTSIFLNWILSYPWWITQCQLINLYGKSFRLTEKLDDLSADERFQWLNYVHMKHDTHGSRVCGVVQSDTKVTWPCMFKNKKGHTTVNFVFSRFPSFQGK